VAGGDENRLVGYTGLPVDLNPYSSYGRVVPVVGAVSPAPGTYDFVFDTPAGGKPGKFTFRVWVNDTAPPGIRLLRATRHAIRLSAIDSGSGVDPATLAPRVDGVLRPFTFTGGVLAIRNVKPGVHRVRLTASDYQEAKNMENVGPILPNTRTFSASVRVP
jgi:hypothetical protein